MNRFSDIELTITSDVGDIKIPGEFFLVLNLSQVLHGGGGKDTVQGLIAAVEDDHHKTDDIDYNQGGDHIDIGTFHRRPL